MIVKEFYKTRTDGVSLYRTYSDNGLKILKVDTDEVYDEAIDVKNSSWTYIETDVPVETDEDEITEEDYQAALREMGVRI